MKATYYIGTLGDSGARISGAAASVEPINDGDFSGCRAAMQAAAQIAVEWSNQPATDNVEVGIAVVQELGDKRRVIAAAIGRPGKKYARWEMAPVWWKPKRKDYE